MWVAYGNVDGAFTGSRVKTGAVGERDAENDEPGVEHELDRGYAAVIRVGRFHSRCNRSEVEEGSLDLVYGISWTGQFKYRAALAPADARLHREVLADAQQVGANAKAATTDLATLRAEVDSSLRKVSGLIDEINRRWPFERSTEIRLP